MLRKKPVRLALWLVAGLALIVAMGWLGYVLILKTPASPVEAVMASPSSEVTTPVSSFVPGVTFAPTTPTGTISARPNLIKPVPSATPIGFGVVTSRSLNLRAEPSIEAAIVGGLKFGDIISLIRRDGSWYQTSDGSWLSSLYLEVRQTKLEAESYARELVK